MPGALWPVDRAATAPGQPSDARQSADAWKLNYRASTSRAICPERGWSVVWPSHGCAAGGPDEHSAPVREEYRHADITRSEDGGRALRHGRWRIDRRDPVPSAPAVAPPDLLQLPS